MTRTLAECIERLDDVRLDIDSGSPDVAWVRRALDDLRERCREELEWSESAALRAKATRWW